MLISLMLYRSNSYMFDGMLHIHADHSWYYIDVFSGFVSGELLKCTWLWRLLIWNCRNWGYFRLEFISQKMMSKMLRFLISNFICIYFKFYYWIIPNSKIEVLRNSLVISLLGHVSKINNYISLYTVLFIILFLFKKWFVRP